MVYRSHVSNFKSLGCQEQIIEGYGTGAIPHQNSLIQKPIKNRVKLKFFIKDSSYFIYLVMLNLLLLDKIKYVITNHQQFHKIYSNSTDRTQISSQMFALSGIVLPFVCQQKDKVFCTNSVVLYRYIFLRSWLQSTLAPRWSTESKWHTQGCKWTNRRTLVYVKLILQLKRIVKLKFGINAIFMA